MATTVCGPVCTSWQPAEKHSVHLSQNKPQNSLPVIKGKGKLEAPRSFDSAMIFIKHVYERVFNLPGCYIKKWHHALLTQYRVSASHEISKCSMQVWQHFDFSISKSCDLLGSADAFYQEGLELARFPSPGLSQVDFPPPVSQHRLPIKWTSSQGGNRGRPRHINKTI